MSGTDVPARAADADPRVTPARVVLAVVLLLVLATAAGAAWQAFATLPRWQVTEQGIVLTEAESSRQVGVELAFVGIGIVLALVWAAVVGVVLRALGWLLVPLVGLATAVAGVLAWRVGLLLGPGDPAATPDPRIGERIPAQPAVDAVASFVVWPVAGLLGLLLATWLVGRGDRVSERSGPSSRP